MITYNFINIRRVFFILLLVVSYNAMYGQQITPVNEKYVNVDLFHGNLNVSIPLYTLKARTLSCPISLNYSPIDILDNNEYKKYYAGTTGLGWSLIGGGCITRIVNGIPDEGIDDLKGNFENHLSDFNPSINTDYDTEEDEFMFNFGGVTGTFVYHKGVWKIFSDEDFNIRENISDTYGLCGFTITTHNGISYKFGGEGIYGVANNSVSYSGPVADAWYLTEITSPEGEIINFNYVKTTVYYKPPTVNVSATQRNYYENLEPINGTYRPEKWLIPGGSTIYYPSHGSIQSKIILSNITTTNDGFSIYFNYLNTNEPFILEGYSRNPLKLDNVVVNYGSYNFKKYVLKYDDKVSESLKLASVQEFATKGNTIEGTMPAFSFLYADKNNPTNPQVLSQITYPTGGYTTFEYEHVMISDIFNLRLKKQTSFGTSSDKELMTTYHYIGNSGANSVIPNFTSNQSVWSGQTSIVDNIFEEIFGEPLPNNAVLSNGYIAKNTYRYTISDPYEPYIYEVDAEGVFKDMLPNATVQEKEIGYSSVWVANSAIDVNNNVKTMGYKHFSFVNFKGIDSYNKTIFHNLNDVGKITQYEEFNSNGSFLSRHTYEYEKIKEDKFSCFTIHSTNYTDRFGENLIWYMPFMYNLNNYKYKIVKETEEDYKGFWKSTECVYDPTNCHLRTKIISSYDPELTPAIGEDEAYTNQTICYRYFSDFRNTFIPASTQEYSQKWMDMPIETIYKKDGKMITGVQFVTLTSKRNPSSAPFVKPETIYTLDITQPIDESEYIPVSHDCLTLDSKLKPRVTFEFDNDGNLVGQALTNGTKTCYVGCSAQNNMPLAILKGMTYDEYVKSGELNNFSPEELMLKRAACPNVQITSYTYDFKFGTPTSVTSPNGLSTYYEYDFFGRLLYVKDNNKNLLKTYEYTSNVQ